LFVFRNRYSEILVKTLLAIEDKYFYQHNGINISSICRDFLKNIIAGRTIQGGSILAQQLVKNLFLTQTCSILRKIYEIYIALILNWFYIKDRILELYLNEVYLRQDSNKQTRGFPLASIYYFCRPIDELNLEQYALLVRMVKGAFLYNSWTYPITALKRRNIVLWSLYHQKYITEKTYQDLYNCFLNILPKGNFITSHPSFVELVCKELKKIVSNKMKYFSGIKVFTTLNPISEKSVEKAVEISISISKKQKIFRNFYDSSR